MTYTSTGASVVRAYCDTIATFCHRCIFFLTFSLLFLLSATSASAQINEAESLELKVITLEQQFDAQVLNVLSNYFDSRKFFVDISIDAQFVDETYRTTENQTILGGQQNQPENVLMPGLPFIPEENMRPREIQGSSSQTTQTVINEQTVKRLQILGLRVNVYADSSFTPEQVEFMRLMAGIAAKISESRGDVVNVRLLNMPDFGIDELPPARAEESLASEETILGSIKDYVPGFVLLMLLGLTLLVGRLTNSPSQKKSKDRSEHPHFTRDELKQNRHQDDLPAFKQNNPSWEKNIAAPEKPKPATSSDFATITDQFLNNSKEVALLFEFWMEEDENEGAKKAARSVKTIDSHLLKALKRDLSSESYSAIKVQLDKTGDLSLSQKKKIASEFVNALEQDLHSHDPNLKHQQLGLFQFLDHLDAHHIKQLLYGEDRNTCALLFDYLPEQKTARVIDWLDKSRVTEIMIGMSNLHELSYNDHKEISSRLFSKAMDILEVDKELKQGAKNILRILDQLPLEDQNKYIEQLKATGSPVADVIANKFITLEQIPRLNDLMLKEALAPISTEVLLEAVSDLSESITNKLLSVRPKREQRLIRMELQQMEYIKDEKSEQAKLQIMKAIREIA